MLQARKKKNLVLKKRPTASIDSNIGDGTGKGFRNRHIARNFIEGMKLEFAREFRQSRAGLETNRRRRNR